jgi:comEA protein
MNLFKPAEIRAILILSVLALLGSTLTLLKRQGKLSSLDLNMFLDDRYNYSYKIEDFKNVDNNPVVQSEEVNRNEAIIDTVAAEVLNLNRAGYFDLQTLPGIGPVLAERILAYRDSAGAFESVEELLKVKGIGDKKLAVIRDRITVE